MTHRDALWAGRTAWRRLALTVVLTLLTTIVIHGDPVASAEDPADEGLSSTAASPREWPSRADSSVARAAGAGHKDDQILNLGPSLQDEAGGQSIGRAQRAGAGDAAGTVRVTVEAVDAATAQRAVASVGGTNTITGGELVEADVRPDRLVDLAAADGVRLVREPYRPSTFVESEGVGTTNADDWQAGTYTGAGVTVAVIDGGFAGYASLLGTELPVTVTPDFIRCDDPSGSEHGTGVAEVVHDMAPDAALRLVCIDTDTEMINALDTLPAAVKVVNISVGWALLDRGDGSGPISAAVDRARDRGVLVAVAAGNYGPGGDYGAHRHQNASGDTPGESLSDLVNMPGGDDGLAFAVAPGEVAFVSLKWDAWPTTAQDFDLYIENTSGQLVGGSELIQDGNDRPIEYASVSNTSGSPRTYFVLVNRYSGTATPRMDLYFDGGVLGIEAPTGSSISDPAVAHGAFTVGAHCYANGTAELFSSVGPTIDGRVKPDISGPDATSSSVYGSADGCDESGFFGTSSAAPHVAGAAALLLDANPLLDVAELQRLLERKAVDAGGAGIDNVYGVGRLQLGPVGDAFLPGPQAFTPMTPTRLYDSRPGTQHPGENPNRTTPIGPNSTVTVPVRGLVGVPSDAVAVALNVTAVAPTAAGWLTVFPGGTAPNASNINFAAGRTTPVHVTATVGSSNSIRIYNSAGNTHVLVDIAGWYGPTGSGGPSTDRLTPLATPARAIDTRPGVPLGYYETIDGDAISPIGPTQTLGVQIAGIGGVPADATAVITNVTSISPTNGTFLTAYPGGDDLPTTSNLNPRAGQTVANLVVVPIGVDGFVSFYNFAGSSHLAVDVLGYFKAGSGAGYVALDPPTRQLDTRTGTGLRRGSLGANGTHSLKVARYDGVPADAAAVMLSAAAVTPTKSTYFTVWPSGATRPNTSNINVAPPLTLANAVLARIDSTGRVSFFNQTGNAHVISDLAGYFIDPANVQLPPP